MATLASSKICQVDDAVDEAFQQHISFPKRMDLLFKWLPAVAFIITDTGGRKSSHTLLKKIQIIILSEILLNSLVEPVKKLSHRKRPGIFSKSNSFPSSHAATSFCGAQILFEECKGYSQNLAVAGYVFASTAAVLRLNSRKHWLSDVIAGAIIGIVTGKISNKLFAKPSLLL